MNDIFSLMSGIAAGAGLRIARDETDGFTISTVHSADMGPETAIIDENRTHIVERYSDESSAREGHAKWIEFVKSGQRNITDVGYGDLTDPEKYTLVPMEVSDE